MKTYFAIIAVLLAVLVSAGNAFALTPAGAVISNKATASYSVGTTNFSEDSNVEQTTVLELIDMTVVWDGVNTSVLPGDTDKALKFTLTNTGNGSDTYDLAMLSAGIGGDDFDPSAVDIYFENTGNTTYNGSTQETQYLPGTNDPTLAAGASMIVYVVNNIPGTPGDGDQGFSRLTATSAVGTGAVGSVVAGAGDTGVDAVRGTSGGDDNDTGTYVVSNVVVSVVKVASDVTDPFGGTQAVPGAEIEYTITVTVSGTGTATSLSVTDMIPTNTTYKANSITLDSVAQSDATCYLTNAPGPRVVVPLGNIAAGDPAKNVKFVVTID